MIAGVMLPAVRVSWTLGSQSVMRYLMTPFSTSLKRFTEEDLHLFQVILPSQIPSVHRGARPDVQLLLVQMKKSEQTTKLNSSLRVAEFGNTYIGWSWSRIG